MVVQERDGVTLGAVIMVEPPLSFSMYGILFLPIFVREVCGLASSRRLGDNTAILHPMHGHA